VASLKDISKAEAGAGRARRESSEPHAQETTSTHAIRNAKSAEKLDGNDCDAFR